MTVENLCWHFLCGALQLKQQTHIIVIKYSQYHIVFSDTCQCVGALCNVQHCYRGEHCLAAEEISKRGIWGLFLRYWPTNNLEMLMLVCHKPTMSHTVPKLYLCIFLVSKSSISYYVIFCSNTETINGFFTGWGRERACFLMHNEVTKYNIYKLNYYNNQYNKV